MNNLRHLSRIHRCLPYCLCIDHEFNDIRSLYPTEACTGRKERETIEVSVVLHWACEYQVVPNRIW